MWNGTEDKIKVKITWIRHGMTQANGEHRYLGIIENQALGRQIGKKEGIFFQSTGIFVYISDETLRSDSGTAF